MSTLSNVNTAMVLQPKQCDGLTPIAIPRAENSKKGVSVEYIPDPDKRWFVMRASYNREVLAADMLIEAGIYAYVVKRYTWLEVDNRRKRVLEILLPNMVFVYLTPAEAEALVHDSAAHQSPVPAVSPILSFYYDHFRVNEYGKNPPAEVSEHEMRNFILATCTNNENMLLLKGGDYRFKGGEEVLINNGEFKGVRGRVIRAKGQQRVLVELAGFATLATAYIPTAFMSVVE